MNLSTKCNCCSHETVCKNTKSYNALKQQLLDVVNYPDNKDKIEVSIKCPNFISNTSTYIKSNNDTSLLK